jgi:hypothetical protein
MFAIRLAAVALVTSSFAFPANAQLSKNGAIPKGYFRDGNGCLHRTPKSVLEGKPQIQNCIGSPAGSTPAPQKPIYTLATPAQVIAALDCDFSAAAQATKGKPMDISKAVVTGSIKFSLVTKDSKGISLSVAAIPVFTGASIAPSLDASNLTETTLSDEYTISVDPAALTQCANPSTNRWLTSKVIIDTAGPTKVDKLETKVSFVVTKQAGAGLKLNIVPVSIGPQFSNNNINSQALSLVFDFKKKDTPAPKPEPAAVPAPVAR